ncbi:hypothetical protein [Microbacterium sp. GXF0217]
MDRRREPHHAIGVIATGISIAPSLIGAALFLPSGAPATASMFVVGVLLVVAVAMAVPVFVGMAVANARGRWPLWLIIAVVAFAVVWGITPFFGSLGVFWAPR